jgi:hypothetical protein
VVNGIGLVHVLRGIVDSREIVDISTNIVLIVCLGARNDINDN